MDLVILRIAFAATSITWSPNGKKFGVTSGAKCVSVCSWSPKHNFWASSLIKKGFKSTVLCLEWCVNNKFIVTGSTDFKCRVHSAYMTDIDSDVDDGFGDIWPKQHTFGALLASFDLARSWINSVAWSPDGHRIAFTGHAGSVHFVQVGGGEQSILTKFLPFADIAFLDDNNVVCGGYDMNPAVFHASGDPADPEWAFAGNVDKEEKKEKKAKKSNTRAARSMFKDMSSRGTKKKGGGAAYLTRHQNCITKIYTLENTAFCTSGLDGRFLFWDITEVPALESVVASMS
jgi:actin related protein 2/3 complex subunit 1A/1B